MFLAYRRENLPHLERGFHVLACAHVAARVVVSDPGNQLVKFALRRPPAHVHLSLALKPHLALCKKRWLDGGLNPGKLVRIHGCLLCLP